MPTYTPTTWVNSSAPAINAANLNHIEQGIAANAAALNATASYVTDGTTPLKWGAFLSAAGGVVNTAWQNAINALFANTTYNTVLDLEGAKITITAGASIPVSGTGGTKSIINGEILAGAGFSGGDYMLKAVNVTTDYFMRLVNVTMNGQGNASWIFWDKGNFVIQACQFKNNKAGAAGDNGRLGTGYNRAGLFCSDTGAASGDAGFWIDNCWFVADDGPTAPTSRQRWGIVSQSGDNKIGGGTTMSYFRHSLISEGPGMIIHGFHPFQGQTGGVVEMTSHTAVVKFTNGRCGAQVGGLYLGKGFMEISNESNTSQEDIGEIVITNMRAYMDNGVASEGHIHARDYGAGGARCSDISITNSYFLNGGSVTTAATKLFNPANFNKNDYHGIYMSGNTFDTNAATDTYEVNPQANPVTLRRTFSTNNTDKTFGFGGFFPFEGVPQRLDSAVSIPDGSSTTANGSQCSQGAITGTDIHILSGASWRGDLTATATCNKDLTTFVEG